MLNCPPTPTKNSIVDLVYPVGSYFITESSNFNTTAKVQAHFGGTWTRVEGRFLYGSSSAGETGGSNDAKVISHSHTFTGQTSASEHYSSDTWSQNAVGAYHNNAAYALGFVDQTGGNKWWSSTTKVGVNTIRHTPKGTISTEGESATGTNMPAYRTVYMYRRTA